MIICLITWLHVYRYILYAFWCDTGIVIIYMTTMMISTVCFVFHKPAFAHRITHIYIYMYVCAQIHMT
jgi:hypothetical protein